MNKIHDHSKLKPYSPAYIKVFNSHSYHKFLKNRPKHLRKLELERYYALDNLKDYRAMGIHVKRLTKSIKSIQNLDFIEFPHQYIPSNIHKDMIKRFLRIKKLSQFCLQTNSKSLHINYLYLRRLKNLKSLILDEQDMNWSKETPVVEKIRAKFFRLLRKIKLEKLEYKLEDARISSHNMVNFPRYPSSLTSWTLFCRGSTQPFGSMSNIHQLLNLNHLQNLKKFQLLTSLPPDLLNHLLESVNSQLKTLALKLTDKENLLENLLSKTRMILAKFQGLEDLAVNSESWIDLFYPSWKLKSLSLEIKTFRKDNLKDLKEFLIQQQASLERLNLQFLFEEQPETFLKEMCDFIEIIGCLKKLQILRLNFTIKDDTRDTWKSWSLLPKGEEEIHPVPILPLLIQAINGFQDLKEVGFRYIGADFSKDFEGFFQAIGNKSNTLEVLEIGLGGFQLQKRDLEILTKTLLELKSLQGLKLGNLAIHDPSFFECFAETIHKCSRLNSLGLVAYKIDFADYNPQDTLKMLCRVLTKSNLHHIVFQENHNGFSDYDLRDRIRLQEMYDRYPHVQTRKVPPYTYHFEIPDNWKGV